MNRKSFTKLVRLIFFVCSVLVVRTVVVAQNFQWARRGGSPGQDESRSIAVDNAGNSYISGYFTGTQARFGTVNLNNPGPIGSFIVKYDNNGNLMWARNPHGYSDGETVVVDRSGSNVYVLGLAYGEISFGSINVNDCIFIARYNSSGDVIEVRNIASAHPGTPGATMAIDNLGNVYVTGRFENTIDLEGTVITTGNIYGNTYVAKFDPHLNLLWVRYSVSINGSTDPYYDAYFNTPTKITIDGSGNCIVAGYYINGPVQFGSTTLPWTNFHLIPSPSDMYVVKYDRDGNLIWATNAESNRNIQPNGISTDHAGNCYITGDYSGTAQFGGTAITSSSSEGTSLFLLKYDASGNVLWLRSANSGIMNGGRGVITDDGGNSYVTGYLSGTVNFGGTVLSAPVNTFFIANFDADGAILWARKANGPGYSGGNDIGLDGINNAYVVGEINYGNVRFGSTVLTSLGTDPFVAKYGDGNALNVYLPPIYPWPLYAPADHTYIGLGPTCFTLNADVGGGVPFADDTYHYSWSTNDTTSSIEICPTKPGTYNYEVIVTDEKGQQAKAIKTIQVEDVRCGANLKNVTVCVTDKTGSYESCLDTSQALLALFAGAEPGSCKVPNLTNSNNRNETKEASPINEESIYAYPNPTSTFFNLKLNGVGNNRIDVTLSDLNGRIIQRKNINGGASQIISFDVANFSKGVYIIRLTSVKGMITRKIIVE